MMADRSEDQGARPLAGDSSGSGRVSRDAGAHTNEPWSYEVHSLYEGFAAIVYAANGMKVGTDYLSEADARRIVACVNACAGIPTEALEDGALRRLLNLTSHPYFPRDIGLPALNEALAKLRG